MGAGPGSSGRWLGNGEGKGHVSTIRRSGGDAEATRPADCGGREAGEIEALDAIWGGA